MQSLDQFFLTQSAHRPDYDKTTAKIKPTNTLPIVLKLHGRAKVLFDKSKNLVVTRNGDNAVWEHEKSE